MEPIDKHIQLGITIERIKVLGREQSPTALHFCCQPFGIAPRQGGAWAGS
jgi:hypothetical protein